MKTETNQKINHGSQFSFHKPVLKVIGLGGGGCNAVNRMIEHGLRGVDFICANTDRQALQSSRAKNTMLLGQQSTRGLGAGGKPEMGRKAALESRKELAAAMQGADMVFLTAGMGGGTGTGSIAIAAQIAKKMGAVTVAVVTTPFNFEGGTRLRNASEGIAELQQHTDTTITIPNERLVEIAKKKVTLETAFYLADDVLRQAIQGITELITEPGIINLDFANIKRHMQMGGGALMSIGQAEGEDRVDKAIYRALNHPLLDAIPVEQATGIIANISGNDLHFLEVAHAMTKFQEKVNPQAEIVWGIVEDSRLDNRVQVTLVVTGLGAMTLEEAMYGEAVQREKPRGRIALDAKELPLPASYLRESGQIGNQANKEAGFIHRFEGLRPVEKMPASNTQPTRMDSYAGVTNDVEIPAFLRRRTRATQ